MDTFADHLLIAQAQEGQPGQVAPAGQGRQGQPPACGGEQFGMTPFFIGMIALFYFFIIRPQVRERQRRTEMLSQLKKNDKVVTIGGIIGVISSVHAETDEVVIRVDETNNTKLRVLRSSIHQVITDEPEGEKSSK